jgi:L-threonylcarbamoyladenylate synthase
VAADLSGNIDLIVDGGPTSVGVESTIVACLEDQPVLLRSGGIARQDIERVLGAPLPDASSSLTAGDDEAPLAPGQLASHYAPRTKLRLDAADVRPGEALLAFGPTLLPGADAAVAVRNLSANGNIIEAAANLFSHLRALDAAGASMIAVMPIPDEGLGEALNDRLRRGAAPPTMTDFTEASKKYRGLGLKVPPRVEMDITPRKTFEDDE